MAIPLENMVGYLRTKADPDDPGKLSIYVDQVAFWKVNPAGGSPAPVLALPPDCAGVLYSVPETGRLEVRYPEE